MLFIFFFILVLLVHAPLLRLPYFWDEAGYYVPAAHDLFLSGSLIPYSTPSNAHPPLVMAYLALWWKLAGFHPIVSRAAMLSIAAFSLLGIFRLAERVANRDVAIAATLCSAIYPVFFTQSSLVHLDLAAAGLTFWGLLGYVNRRWKTAGLWFSLAVLAKETAILAPLALFIWEVVSRGMHRRQNDPQTTAEPGEFWLLAPIVPLLFWYGYHFRHTGFVFGNPEFFRYNVHSTLHPLRILLAFATRLWQVMGYFGMFMLTLSALFSMWLPPRNDASGERPRIDIHVQLAFLAVTLSYTFALAVLGGAVLARYMLPVIPLVIIVCCSTLWRRVRFWRPVIAVVCLTFIAGLFINPPYGFSLEDNLIYRDSIILHQHAEHFLEVHFPNSCVLTAWPASDEISLPYLGYVQRPMRVLRIEDFSIEQLLSARNASSQFDVALVFSTKYEPSNSLLRAWPLWEEWKTRFFGYHVDVPPEIAGKLLGGQLVYSENRHGLWVGVIEMQNAENASAQRNRFGR